MFGSYQALLGAHAYKRCLLGVYSYRLATFIFIVMADSASISFLTRTDARTHAHQENPYIEVGQGQAHLVVVVFATFVFKVFLGGSVPPLYMGFPGVHLFVREYVLENLWRLK